MKIDVDFANEVVVKYHYMDNEIEMVIVDPQDISELKSILRGKAIKDNPSCGFTPDISLIFSDDDNNITLCPACDTCALFRVDDSNRYIKTTKEQRQRFEEIVKKYGMEFPCI